MNKTALFIASASLLTANLSADIITVGGPNGTYTEIGPAVLAAQDGDTILVDIGQYAPFTIDDKALTISPRIPGIQVETGEVTISNLAAGKRVHLRGLDITAGLFTSGLLVTGCAGSVRVDNCQIEGFDEGVMCENSADVVFDHTDIDAGALGSDAVRSTGSNIALFRCEVIGSPGQAQFNGQPGGVGIWCSTGSLIFASDCIIAGGDGGDGNFGLSNGLGGPGGWGVEGPAGCVTLLDCTVSGGDGGTGGLGNGADGQPGTGTVIPGTSKFVDVRGSIVDTKPIVLEFTGEPGDAVEFAYTILEQQIPQTTAIGPLLIDTLGGPGYTPIGTIPASGSLEHTIHIGDVPVQAGEDFAIQGRMTDPAGTVTNTNAPWITIYDQCAGVVPVGTVYCTPAAPNSSGMTANIHAYGSDCAATNEMFLTCYGLPANQFGIFLASPGEDFVVNAGGSIGNLCLGGGFGIGRYNQASQIQTSNQSLPGLGHYFKLELDITQIPSPTGPQIALANQRWYFQAWFRDNGQTRFSDGLQIRFR